MCVLPRHGAFNKALFDENSLFFSVSKPLLQSLVHPLNDESVEALENPGAFGRFVGLHQRSGRVVYGLEWQDYSDVRDLIFK